VPFCLLIPSLFFIPLNLGAAITPHPHWELTMRIFAMVLLALLGAAELSLLVRGQ
jgi:hypothetical protein